ncbi:MAG: hypothetical protein EXQ98_06125 [Alphaproteobacteria bacterium]|nr:hypothetical protein [Alphaproteobacteria bacterium]
MNSAVLPDEFNALMPFIAWALPTERERTIKRLASSMDELNGFYAAAMARLEAIVAFLDREPLEQMSDKNKPLMHLMLSLVEISNIVELYKRLDKFDGMHPSRFVSSE